LNKMVKDMRILMVTREYGRFIAHPLMSFTPLILAIDLMLLSGITRTTPVKEEQLHVGREAYVVLVVSSAKMIINAWRWNI